MKLYVCLMILILFSTKAFTQNKEPKGNKTKEEKKEITVTDFIPSLKEENEEGSFNLYALSFENMWFFIVDYPDDRIVLTLAQDSLVQTSDFFENGVLKIITKYGLKPSPKSVSVNDLLLKPYYSFNRQASKSFKTILFLEYGYFKKTNIKKMLGFLTAPISALIKKKTSAEKQIKKMNSYKKSIDKEQKKYEVISDHIL